jgi:hypothetical protein
MATRTTPVGTHSGTDYLSAAEENGAAGGWIGYVEVTADQSGITSIADLTSLSVTVTVGADRLIKITGCVRASNGTASKAASLYIYESTTELQRADAHLQDADIGAGITATRILNDPSTGTHTYKLRMASLIGGTATMRASADEPAFILVEDLGPAF